MWKTLVNTANFPTSFNPGCSQGVSYLYDFMISKVNVTLFGVTQ